MTGRTTEIDHYMPMPSMGDPNGRRRPIEVPAIVGKAGIRPVKGEIR
jgi:hypothetical protein